MITRSDAFVAHAQARAKACHASAEAADHPADKAALRGAARLWEKVAGPGVPWSLEPVRRQLRDLKRELALASGPFTPKNEPPRPAAPAPAPRALPIRQEATIEF